MQRRSPRRSASRAAAAATSPTSTSDRRTSTRPIPTSAARRSRATRRATSSTWSSGTASAGTRSTKGSSSATSRARRSSPCCCAECDAGAVQRWQPCRVEAVRVGGAGFELDTARGPVRAARLVVASGGLLDSEDRRERLGLRDRAPARPSDRRAAAGARPLPARPRRRAALRRARGRLPGGARGSGTRAVVRRGPALHPPRPERAGGAADLDLLARGRIDRDRSGARAATCAGALGAAKIEPAPARHGAGRHAAAPPRRRLARRRRLRRAPGRRAARPRARRPGRGPAPLDADARPQPRASARPR